MTIPAAATRTVPARRLQGLEEANVESVAHFDEALNGLSDWIERLRRIDPDMDGPAVIREAQRTVADWRLRVARARAEVLRLTSPEPQPRYAFGDRQRFGVARVVGGATR
jgi:hypothetical protein